MMMSDCNKDPDGARCKSLRPPPKPPPLNFYEQCKWNPENVRCKAYLEKLYGPEKEEPPDTNRF